LVADGLKRAIVELLQGSSYQYLDGWHWWEFWLMDSTKSRSEKTSLNLGTPCVTNVVERIVLEEIVVKDLIAVLLVNIATLENAIRSFDSLPQLCFIILVKNGFPLWVT